MLETLDSIPWEMLEHAYGSAEDVPGLLRQLLDPDPATRSETLEELYGNVFHQGTRYPATPYVVPFLIEMCSSPWTFDRGGLLHLWKSLITGYFSVQERPVWGNGETIYWGDEVQEADVDDPFSQALHQIYLESVRGHGLLLELLRDTEPSVRGTAAGVLACLRTLRATSVPRLVDQLSREDVGGVRAAIAFALGELGAVEPLRQILKEDDDDAARCMAACELARISPDSSLVEPLMRFVAEPISGYDAIPGTGGKSTGDAADAIARLPREARWAAAGAICERLQQTRSFDTMPLVQTLLATAFEPSDVPVRELSEPQRQILGCLVECQELWPIGNLFHLFPYYGLPHDRKQCAALAGVPCVDDKALKALSAGVLWSNMGFLDKGREHIEEALRCDPTVFDRTPAPDECWLMCAKAYAETDAPRALEAFRRAVAADPFAAHRVDPAWTLAWLLAQEGGAP